MKDKVRPTSSRRISSPLNIRMPACPVCAPACATRDAPPADCSRLLGGVPDTQAEVPKITRAKLRIRTLRIPESPENYEVVREIVHSQDHNFAGHHNIRDSRVTIFTFLLSMQDPNPQFLLDSADSRRQDRTARIRKRSIGTSAGIKRPCRRARACTPSPAPAPQLSLGSQKSMASSTSCQVVTVHLPEDLLGSSRTTRAGLSGFSKVEKELIIGSRHLVPPTSSMN